jgi:hypothetical protein
MEKLPVNIPQIKVPTPDIGFNISLKLNLIGGDAEGYRIQDFQMGFLQDIDFKGQPQYEVTGGLMTIVITQVPDDVINKWVMNSRSLMSGSFVFKHLGHTLLSISFEDAYCVGYKKDISSISGVSTRIVISPKSVNLNGILHENFWRK